jgi:hypothetical protein
MPQDARDVGVTVGSIGALRTALLHESEIELAAAGSPYVFVDGEDSFGFGPTALSVTRNVTIRAEAGGEAATA